MLNIQKMMQQAQQMQMKMQEMQEKLKDIIVSGQAGDGLVTVEMTCTGAVQSVRISPTLVDANDVETLEDMVVAAMNNAGQAKDIRVAEETKQVMADAGVPAGMAGKLPF